MSGWVRASAPGDDDEAGGDRRERFSLRGSTGAIATGVLMVLIIGVLGWVAVTGGGSAASTDGSGEAAAAPAENARVGQVPDVIGTTQAAAMAALRAAGYEGVITVSRADDAVDKGQIANQIPTAGSRLATGSKVELALSLGAADRPVPNVAGYPAAGALTLLQQAGLGYTATTEWSNQPNGTVLRSTPSAGTPVAKGAEVALVLSSGPAWDVGATVPAQPGPVLTPPARPATPVNPSTGGVPMTPTTHRPSVPLASPTTRPPVTRPPVTRPPVTVPPFTPVTRCLTTPGPDGRPWTLCM